MPDGLIEIARKAGSPKPKSSAAGVRLAEEDDWSIERANRYIVNEAPEVAQGHRDNTAATVARRSYDFAISNGTCMELMLRWNETKCSPPLEFDDIQRIVRSAEVNRDNAIGCEHPDNNSGFDAVEIDESRKPKRLKALPEQKWDPEQRRRYGRIDEKEESETKPFVSLATPYSFRDPATINPPDWIIEGLAARGEVSTTTGPGGVSKSTWALHVAVAVVTGRSDICGFRIPRRDSVWVWNQEDSEDTMYARLSAIMQEYNISPYDLLDENGEPGLFLDSGRGRGKRLTLVERRDGFLKPTAQLDRVIKTAVSEGFGLTMLDPLVSLHQASENVNEEMRAVFDHLADIAQDANCAVHAMSHTGKPDKKSSDGFAGDAYAARGASAQPDAARVASTFMSMSKEDLKRWSVPNGTHLEYARLDVAKINDGPKPSEPQWYWRKQIIVDGYRGGRLPVLKPVNLELKEGASAEEMAAQIARSMQEHCAPETWMPVSDLLQHLPAGLRAALGGENRGRDLNRLFDFKQEVHVEGGVLKRETGKGRAGTKLSFSKMPHSSNASNPVEE
jgi:hypothetical protein